MPARTRKANAAKSAVRGHVEHVFAYQKGPMGMVVRTIGIARVKATLTPANMALSCLTASAADRSCLTRLDEN